MELLECDYIIFEVNNSLESLNYKLGMAEEKIQQKNILQKCVSVPLIIFPSFFNVH